MIEPVPFYVALLESKATNKQKIEWLTAAVEHERQRAEVARSALREVKRLMEQTPPPPRLTVEAIIDEALDD